MVNSLVDRVSTSKAVRKATEGFGGGGTSAGAGHPAAAELQQAGMIRDEAFQLLAFSGELGEDLVTPALQGVERTPAVQRRRTDRAA